MRIGSVFLSWALLILLLILPVDLPGATSSRSVASELRGLLLPRAPQELLLGTQRVLLHPQLAEFYGEQNHLPAWVDGQGAAPEAGVLLTALRGGAAEGLVPTDYPLELLTTWTDLAREAAGRGTPLDGDGLARLDLLLTSTLLRYAEDHQQGREAFAGLRAEGTIVRNQELVRTLSRALREGRLETALAELVPAAAGYGRLLALLADYRQWAKAGGWIRLPDGPVLHPGESDARLPLLRQRLIQSGDLFGAGSEAERELLDPATVRALRNFQRRHGLAVDGILGAQTLAELNVPVSERIVQIEMNLERWRWLGPQRQSRYLEVNIADFSLQVLEDEQEVMAMSVIVGREVRKTPLFSAQMTYLEFSPYWQVPPTILREDKLPLIRKDPGYLQKNHFEIVSWRDSQQLIDPDGIDWSQVTAANFPGMLRQKPGPWNALGQIKFMFPNKFAIYLHDTPDKHLFRQRVRLFSSGCIRIERPMDLAQYLLEPQGMGYDALLAATQRSTPLRVSLRRPMPVRIQYWTCWVDADGDVQFRRDFYGLDQEMATVLRHWRQRQAISEQVFEPAKGDQGAQGRAQG